MKFEKKNLLNNQWFFLLLVVIGLSVITGIINPKYFYLRNVINILEQISVLGLVASGATILMISGNFDISVGATIGLASCIMAIFMKNDMPSVPAVSIGVCVAILCCFFVGLNSILFRAPSFIISLACIGIFKGIALALTEGTIQTIYGKFEMIGALRIFNVIPLLFIISLLGYIAVHIILTYTRLGRRVYAIGSNRQAAYRSGIAVNKNTLIFFTLNGLLVGIAAMLLLSRVGAVQPSTGSGIELQAIGAVVIGGAPMTGGKGKIIGTFFGVLLMGVLSNVLNMLRVNPYFQDITFGALIIVSLAITAFSQRD
ncbi:ribose/xylose/arabinose/galactoside ABC-type transport system, permease component [Candidatus Vecturithrix granuli]|uniref:Ribose/xylose/arabinose/galactoside ABC-type transport system, permease component n=1 Tax=Vecturithrix granuli TaxID=1499967 RepID=A0A081BYZ7_VECG1|nr:ribose/xylose/arabinose/galactoside ABC-type transport system, permease component [Candidatus Vecturithrix granuli]